MENNQEIENVLQKGYHLDIGDIIGQSIDNFKKSFLMAGVAIFLFALIIGFFGFGVILFFSSANNISDTLTNFNFSNLDFVTQIGTLFGMLLFTSVSAIITAGFYRMFFKSANNEAIEIGDAFYYFQSSYIKELIISGSIIGGINFVVSQYLNQYMLFSGSLFSYLVSFCTLFTIPLIIFKNCTAIQAINYSVKLVFKQPIAIFVLLLFAFIIAMLGLVALCIGIIFTASFVYCMTFTIFNKIFPYDKTSPLDEIGKTY